MNNKIQNKSDLSHARLRRYLYPVAKRILQSQQLKRRTLLLLRVLFIAFGFAALSFFQPVLASSCLIVIFALIAGTLINSWKSEKRQHLDFLAAAQAVEAEHPELKQALLTSVEQELEGQTGFFSQRTTGQVLAEESRTLWHLAGLSLYRRIRIKYLGTLAALLAVMLACYQAGQNHKTQINQQIALASTELYVEPGDMEIERGSSVVITARFDGSLPKEVFLEARNDNDTIETFPMAQSLSDPVFAYSLHRIESAVSYQIRYADTYSDEYRIKVFVLPELAQANASLQFPDYTGWQDRVIDNTLRISAIEGTELSYTFNANKPLSQAYLLDKKGDQIPLTPSNEQNTQFTFNDLLTTPQTYSLHLVDFAGRRSPYPPEIRIDAIPNQRPNLRLSSPRGDQRLSPLEEIVFTGTASDDFGLLDYGIGFVVADEKSKEISLVASSITTPSLKEDLSYLLALETYSLQAQDSLSWYLWADDFGPDGERRHSTGDLYFANIRSLDEIFREQDQGASSGASQGGAANQGIELVEKQRRIVISLFRIKNTATKVDSVIEDLDVLQRSQVEALNELQELIPNLDDSSARQAATTAQRLMEGVDIGLTRSIDTPTLEPLDLAWNDAQGAYQHLVKLSESEFNVSRSQSSQNSGGGGSSRNQSQLNQLDFRQDESRYETSSEAQPLSSPEEKQNIELIAKLNELSRRQDDMNERLQDMQNALANAKTEEERQRIERELKRLEEEQRDLIADADDAIQQAGNRESARQARQQLEEARENMQRTSKSLEEGEISQALASGTRAQDTLEKSKEQMRERNSSQFSEAMRQARSQSRDLAESQRALEEELKDFKSNSQPRLDDNEERTDLAEKIEQQAEKLDALLDQVREIAGDSEIVEPGLFRQLYQVLRDSNSSQFENRYENSAQLLRQGFLDDARKGQQGLSNDLEKLSEAIASAAESILGNERSTLQFAQNELDSLSDQLQEERDTTEQSPSSAPSDSPSSASTEETIRNALSNRLSSNNGPLTGGSFNDWVDRLSTIESLIEEPLPRAQIAEAREIAEGMRRDFKRHGSIPQWVVVENQVAAPLNAVSSWLTSELNRIENPDALQPVDSDPVPEEYNAAVQRYYESLGND